MPYVSQDTRRRIEPRSGVDPLTPGELNYLVTTLVNRYVDTVACGELRYDIINEVIGVLECAKLELYRRVAAPYEDRKCAENGDVYT